MACDLLRRSMRDANKCVCKPPPKKDPRAQCQGLTKLPDSCLFWELANRRDQLFKMQYSFDSVPWADEVTKKAYTLKLQDMHSGIAHIEAKLKLAFPDITDEDLAGVEYWKLQRCFLNDGGMPRHNAMTGTSRKYFGRADLQSAGYVPDSVVDLAVPSVLKMPQQVTDMMPVLGDRLAAPEYVILMILLVLTAVAIALGVSVYRRKGGKHARGPGKRGKTSESRGTSDPWANMGMTLDDPDDKLRELVPQYESRGYCMTQYRKKLGMPPGPPC